MHGEKGLPTKQPESSPLSFPPPLVLLVQLLLMTAVGGALYFTGTAFFSSLALLLVLLTGSILFTTRSYRNAQRKDVAPHRTLPSSPVTSQEKQVSASSAPPSQRVVTNLVRENPRADLQPFDLAVSHAIDFNLRTTIEETISRFTLLAKEKGVELSCLFSSDSPTPFRGDPGDIRLILMNLIDYTLTYLTDGEILLHATLTQQTSTHATFRFSLSTASAIPFLASEPSNFSPAPRQEDRATLSTDQEGGIAISKQLVKTFGGQLEIERTPDTSPTIWFTLTLEKQKTGNVVDLSPRTNLFGIRLLLISDSFSLLDEDVSTWGLAEHHVTRFPNAWSTITAAVQSGRAYDVVLIHGQELSNDTLDLAARVRAAEELAAARLVFLTNTGMKGDARRVRQAGFDAYLTFPVSPQVLFECIATVLGQPPQPLASDLPLVTRYTLAEARMRGRARILIVDSNLGDQRHAARLVEELGYRADVAVTAREAIEAHIRLPYAAILLPTQMAGIDGIAAATQIRQHDRHDGRHTPLIGILQSQSDSERTRCLVAGMDAVVSKPLLIENLKITIDHYCSPSTEQPAALTITCTKNNEAAEVNLHEALARIDGDKELFDEMAALFCEEYPKALAKMREAVTRQDSQALVYSANVLKGSLGNFAATTAIAVTQSIEQMGRQGDLVHALPALADLEKHLAYVRAVLTDFRLQAAA